MSTYDQDGLDPSPADTHEGEEYVREQRLGKLEQDAPYSPSVLADAAALLDRRERLIARLDLGMDVLELLAKNERGRA